LPEQFKNEKIFICYFHKFLYFKRETSMADVREAVIIGAARTPTGKFQGLLKGFKAPELGAIAIKAAIERAGVKPEDVDEVIMGCVVQAGIGQAPARQAALKAGLPPEVSALTVNMVCGSGLRAVALSPRRRSNSAMRKRSSRAVWNRCRTFRMHCRRRATGCGWAIRTWSI
jgi:hypothetical protein